MSGPYNESTGTYLGSSDVQHDVANRNLTESSLNPGTFYDGNGNQYDGDYNPKD